jgi:hypothetical protein
MDVKDLAPDPIKAFSENTKLTIDELFRGESMEGVRERLKNNQIAEIRTGTGDPAKIVAHLSEDGQVLAMAAAVSRTPITSEKYLRDNVPDLKKTGKLNRTTRIELYQEIYSKEGIVNNAIKKKASLVSQDGNFMVRAAKQGRRPAQKAMDDLLVLLRYWEENVNSAGPEAAITGSRGIRQVIRRGVRQSLITGDLFVRQEWNKITVPQLGRKFSLPMFLQALPSEEVEIAEEFLGLGIELFYWKPPRSKVQRVLGTRDPNVKKIVTKALNRKLIEELRKTGKAVLDPALLVHVKNGGTDTDAYGQSDVEASMTDIAYARALKSLDFVTIDSLINRMLVIKVGDSNPDSKYHDLATAQARINVFARLIQDVGPNMLILWAGHDVDTTDIGAHNTILNTDDRHLLAKDMIKMGTGVPDPILTGSADGGNAVAWAGFLSLAAVVAESQEEWSQALTQLGLRIAEQNGFRDADVVWHFAHRLLADREANAKVMLQGFDRGVLSKRSLAEELGKDFDVEIFRRQEEQDKGFDELFAAPQIRGGPGGIQGPGAEPGRPDRRTDIKVGPDRNREDKNLESSQ